ncbi:MAG: glycosyltransferase [Coriobacteriia bacterium]|nr:glycosyltransferase [Coriobacteriia bacterium]
MAVKPKVLVFGISRNLGGTEVVVSRFIGQLSDQFQFDTFATPMPLQPEYVAGDNRVILMPMRRQRPLAHVRQMRQYFKDHAHEYAAVWYNVNNFSNLGFLQLAAQHGIPVRLCHFHNSDYIGNKLNRMLSGKNKAKVPGLATSLLACSNEAGTFAYGNAPFSVVNNAFHLGEFAFDAAARQAVRAQLGCEDAFVIGTVGRLTQQKNHQMLIRLMPEILRRRPEAKLVIVGGGALDGALKQQVADAGLAGSVVLAGMRSDAAALLSAFDVFAFPSRFEGLGVAAVEAQANGLPCVASEAVPHLTRVSDSAQYLPLDNDTAWVDALCAASRETFAENPALLAKFDLQQEAPKLAAFLTGERR